MDCQKFFIQPLTLITLEVCDQDLPYSLDTTKNISIKEVPQVVIRDASCM